MDEARLVADACHELRAGMDEVKRELAGLSYHVEGLKDRVGLQNGRVGKLEAVNALREIAEAHDRGRVEGRAGVVLTKGQLAGIAAALTALVGSAGGIAGLVVKFL